MSVKLVTRAIQRLYPPHLADSSWDNTGLLVNCGGHYKTPGCVRVLLAIDLTCKVTQEAIDARADYIVAYHPLIFKGLKRISMDDTQQASIVRLIKNDISVYCPHTAIDAAVGGVNDFLAGIVSGQHPMASWTAIQPVKNTSDNPKCGYGRLVQLGQPVSVHEIIQRCKSGLGLGSVHAALCDSHRKPHTINTVALCAGSGGSVLANVNADVHVTGELGHHQILHLVESGSSVILCGHSNTERGFLGAVLQSQLHTELTRDFDGTVDVIVSQSDKDPLEIV